MTTVPWTDYLGALEEWVRRVEAAVAAGDVQEPEPFALAADGPLPPELRVRVRALLDGVQRAERAAVERRAALQRAQAYAQH